MTVSDETLSHVLNISYDDDVLLGTGLSANEFEEEARFLLAAKLFELGRISSGKAAQLCGKSRVEFLVSLKRIGVSMTNLGPEDLGDEIAFASRA